jgi:RimJ/RimL family protein N-acetyltransferase
MRLEPFVLTGTHVRLEPLALGHASALVDAANRDRSSYAHTPVPSTVEAMHAYIDWLLADAERDTVVPFAQVRAVDGVPVGCTRYLNVTWYSGRELPAEVEIGGTWLTHDAQRTAINTEAKLLLLTQAFEHWKVVRVAICTDALNERSRSAIERLGASFEGILRHHRMRTGDGVPPGEPRDTASYSILPDEWPEIRARLQDRLS